MQTASSSPASQRRQVGGDVVNVCVGIDAQQFLVRSQRIVNVHFDTGSHRAEGAVRSIRLCQRHGEIVHSAEPPVERSHRTAASRSPRSAAAEWARRRRRGRQCCPA